MLEGWRLPDIPAICGRYVDRRTRPNQNPYVEEGFELNLLNERFGSDKIDFGDAHHSGPVKEVIVAIAGEVRDEGD